MSNGPEYVTINSKAINKDQLRLDASYYDREAANTESILQNSGFELKTLDELTELRYLTRFKRIWLTDETVGGVPYLSASETMSFKPLRRRFISKQGIKNPELYFTKKDWILIECSGTIGVPVFVNKTLEPYFLDNHLLRLIPNEETLSGYVYAFLYTKYGQTLLKRGQYGFIVKEIDPRQVGPIPIPMLPQQTQKKIHEKIVKASELRDEANILEDEAIKMVEKCINDSQTSS